MRTGALLLTVGLLSALAVRAQQEERDDVEVTRVWLRPENVEAELTRARQGVLEKMPLPEFDRRLRLYREARKAAAALPAPQLVNARYLRLRLHEDPAGRGEPYLAGAAEWTVRHGGPGPAVLPLQPLSLALSKIRYENRSAVVGDFDGEQPGLLVGDHVRSRHEVTAEGTASEFDFDLRVGVRGLSVLRFGCDAPLKPHQIGLVPGDAARLDRTEFQENGPGGRSVLTLHFREPI